MRKLVQEGPAKDAVLERKWSQWRSHMDHQMAEAWENLRALRAAEGPSRVQFLEGDERRAEYEEMLRRFDGADLQDAKDAHRAYRRGPQAIMATYPGGADDAPIHVMAKHFRRLSTHEQGWLHDEVINMQMWLMQMRDSEQCRCGKTQRPSHFFNSYLMEKMLEPRGRNGHDYKKVGRWARKIKATNGDVFGLDKLFAPINTGRSHWALVVVYIQTKKIAFIDSMGGTGMAYLEAMRSYLWDEAKVREVPVDWRAWDLVPGSTQTPQQQDCVNCGVFTIITTNFLAQNLDLRFSSADIANLRIRITLECLRGRLFGCDA